MLTFFKQLLDDVKEMSSFDSFWFLICFFISIGIFIWIKSFISTKAKIDANNINFSKLTSQLEETTKLTKKIESEFSISLKKIEHNLIQETWVSQQVWIKKQEIYENTFKILSNLNKYINYENTNLEDYIWFEHGIYQEFNTNGDIDEEYYNETMKQRDAYYREQKTEKAKLYKKSMIEIKKNSISSLLDILYLQSIFLSDDSRLTIENIINDINVEPTEHEEWENYVYDILKSFKNHKKDLLLSAKKELSLLI